MTRPGALGVALGLALVAAPLAAAQVMPPAPESPVMAPRTARVDSSTVRLLPRRMVRDLHVVIPGGGDGVATINWQAYGGSRSATRLARIAHGRAVVPIRGGELHFRRRVKVGGGFDRSGGFCEVIDLTSVGAVMPTAAACPDGDGIARDQIPARVPEFTMYGDSVGAGLQEVAGGTARAAGDASAVFDLKVCRRLTYLPCPPNPPSVLTAVRSQPGSVGDIAVIDVGYNDWAQVYGIEPTITALRARGVKRIVWVTLRESEPGMGSINAMIRAAARRHPFVQVADWNAASAGIGGFAADGVHLSGGSAVNALADFVRREVQKAVAVLQGS